MKILFLSQSTPYPIYLNGLTVRVYFLLKEFSKMHECYFISFQDNQLSDNDIHSLEKMTVSYDIIPYNSYKQNFISKIASPRRYFCTKFEHKVQQAIHTFKPDVIFAEQTFMSQYAAKIVSIPKIISAVDAISLAAIRRSRIGNNFMKKIALRYVAWQRLIFERKYFPQFDKITVVSLNDAQYLQDKLRNIINVIPNGVDTTYFNPAFRQNNRNSIVFSGNLSAPMNEEAVIYILKYIAPFIHQIDKNVRFSIVGRNPSEKIKKLNKSYVTITDNVPDMRYAISDALLYISPIKYGTGIKNNVLQAMAMGIPVLTTPLIADPIGIKDKYTGFVAKRTNFIKTIESILTENLLLENIGINGRRHIENNFSWPHIASQYFKMFSEIVAHR